MTIQQHASFDSSAAELNATSKLVKAWESKNAKNAARAGGVSLMALSLAACGGSSEEAAPTVLKTVYDAAVTAKAAAEAEATAATTAKTAAETAQAAAEATATAATAAKVAAEADAATATAAKTAAETAKTAAETAQATAEAAQVTAEAAQAVAVAAQAAAETAKATADAALAAQNTAITDAGFADVDALIAAYEALVAPVTTTLTDFGVTAAVDVVSVSSGNDIINGTDATIDSGDIIVDSSTTDSDTLNLSASAFVNSMTTAGATITNIENVNVTFDSLVQSTFVSSGINTASTITIAQARSGGSGDMVVQNVADGTTIVAGAGVTEVTLNTMTANNSATINAGSATGTITADVSGTATLNVTAASAASVDVSSVTGAITVSAAAATTIDVEATTGLATVTGGAATSAVDVDTTGDQVVDATASKNAHAVSTGLTSTVSLIAEGNAIDIRGKTTTVTLVESDTTDGVITADGVGVADTLNVVGGGDDFTIANGGTNAVETINVSLSAAQTATITTAAATTYTGDANTTFAGDEAMFDGKTVTGASALSITTLDDSDLSKVATLIDVNSSVASKTLTVADDASLKLSADIDTTLTVKYTDGTAATATDGVVTVDLNVADISGDLALDVTADTVKTLNLVSTVASDDGNLVVTAGSSDVIVTGAAALTLNASSTAAKIDASAATGVITATANGTNEVVTTGSGRDVVTVSSTASTMAVNTNSGNDTINTAAVLTGTVNGGDGTDTLNITGAIDLSGATISNIEIVDINANAVTVDEALLNGNAVVVDGTAALTVGNILNSLDLGNVSFSSTASTVIDFGNRDASLGASGNLTATGTGNIDIITTGNGTNIITAGAGADEITGGSGVDTILGGDGADAIDGGAGADSLNGGNGADVIAGAAGADTITGDAGVDYLWGGAAADTISGGAGADVIAGGAGADTMTGGAGADNYVYASQGVATVATTTDGAAGPVAEVQTVTLTGQFFAGEVVTVTSAGGTLAYTAVTGDTLTEVAAGLAAATGSAGFEFTATSSGAVLTLTETVPGGADIAASTVAVAGIASTDAAVSISAANVVQGFDTITDFVSTEDTITYTSSTGTSAAAAVSGTAGTTATSDVEVSAGGKVTFAAADDTLAEMIVAIEADDTDIADGEIAFFELGSDTYIYIANDTSDDTTDNLIMLEGVTGFSALTIATDVITIA